jgi:23S rRNA (cytosine1962-C5)-methyltransferase
VDAGGGSRAIDVPGIAAPADGGTGDYALLDIGDGRRLERFGPHVLDRPAPATIGLARRDPGAWGRATARFDRDEGGSMGRWVPPDSLPERWMIDVGGIVLELRPTPSGQVGVFPEHLPVARWALAGARAATTRHGRPAEVLNLFAYTGLATLVLARAGARVAHVDASRPAVAWARRNAELAGVANRPIRWLVDDAARFVAREARRGRRYDGVLLDPPTYGHGPGGGAWRLDEGLPALLASIRGILAAEGWFVGCTAHAAGLPPVVLDAMVRDALGIPAGATETHELVLVGDDGGVRLAAGSAVLATHPGTALAGGIRP